jgi:hypothetical protein
MELARLISERNGVPLTEAFEQARLMLARANRPAQTGKDALVATFREQVLNGQHSAADRTLLALRDHERSQLLSAVREQPKQIVQSIQSLTRGAR